MFFRMMRCSSCELLTAALFLALTEFVLQTRTGAGASSFLVSNIDAPHFPFPGTPLAVAFREPRQAPTT